MFITRSAAGITTYSCGTLRYAQRGCAPEFVVVSVAAGATTFLLVGPLILLCASSFLRRHWALGFHCYFEICIRGYRVNSFQSGGNFFSGESGVECHVYCSFGCRLIRWRDSFLCCWSVLGSIAPLFHPFWFKSFFASIRLLRVGLFFEHQEKPNSFFCASLAKFSVFLEELCLIVGA